MSQILDKIGIPKPFLPTPDNIDVFRQRWSAGTTHFANSPVAKQALASGGGINWSQHDIRIPARDGDGTGEMDLVRMLWKTSQINKHAPLQNETMTERFRGRWTNAVWLVSWINDFAEFVTASGGLAFGLSAVIRNLQKS